MTKFKNLSIQSEHCFLPWRWRCPHLMDQRGYLHALWLLHGCWCPASLQAACEWQFPIHIKISGLVSTLSSIIQCHLVSEGVQLLHLTSLCAQYVWVCVCTCMPGGEGSLRTSMRISLLLESRALTASWWVACRRSMEFTSRMRSPTRNPLWQAKPWGITYSHM